MGDQRVSEQANAAFFYDLMCALPAEHPHVDREMQFEDAKGNFFAAARHGLKAQLTWAGGRPLPAAELILGHLLPRAREGLRAAGIEAADIDRFLGVIEERMRRRQTGAQWALSSLAAMGGEGSQELRHRALCAAMLEHQREEDAGAAEGAPVHTWAPAALPADTALLRDSYRTVGQFMSAALFTVRPDDLVDFAASVMEWRHIRHVPVEDAAGRLVGVVSHRALLQLLAGGAARAHGGAGEPAAAGSLPTVASIMRADPVTVTPETEALEAMRIVREARVGCLPVVAGERLVGIVTERDLLEVAARLLESTLRGT